MIQEDYVNEEIMGLLFEKDYWQERSAYYTHYVPTQSQVMKWLREVHNIEIAISYGIIFEHNTLKQVFRYFWSIVKVNGLCLEFPLNTPGDVCNKEIEANSYEEAIQAAIKYVLENLI